MALFDTLVPQINQFTAPTPAYTPPTPKYGGQQILSDLLAAGQIAAGIGLTATGAGATAGIPLIVGGASTAYNTNKQFLREGTGFHGLPAGSHESGNDLTLVHSKTGAPTGIKMEGDEILVGSENSKALRDAVTKKDKKAVWDIISAQMKEKPKKYDGEVKLDGGTGANGIPYSNDFLSQLNGGFSFANPNAAQYSSSNPTWASTMGNIVVNGIPYAGTNDTNYLAPTPQGNNYNFADTSWAAGMPYAPKAASAPTQQGQYNMPMGGSQSNINFADPSTWTTPTTMPTAQAPTAAAPNKWGYLASALPGALQTVYGLSQMNKTLPSFQEPQSYKNYLGQLQQMSTRGYTPEEQNYINRNIQGTYGIGLNNLKNNSGGNSAAVLGGLNNLGNAMNEAKLKSAAQGAELQRQNLLNYGQGLTQEAQLYNLPQQEWLMKNYLAKQQMANQFVDSGLGNLEGSYLNYLHATDPNRGMFNNEVKRIS